MNLTKQMILSVLFSSLLAGCSLFQEPSAAKIPLGLSAAATTIDPGEPVSIKISGLHSDESENGISFTHSGGQMYRKDGIWYFAAEEAGEYQLAATTDQSRKSRTLTIRVGNVESKKDAANNPSQKSNASNNSTQPVAENQEVSTVNNPVTAGDSYDVDTVLRNASSLLGTRFMVTGNLPQTTLPDQNSQQSLVILSDTGKVLRLKGHINIGSCQARLSGILEKDDKNYVFTVDGYEQLTFPVTGNPSGTARLETSADPLHQGIPVYDVDTVLAQADQLAGQRFTVTGNLPQNALPDQNGNPVQILISQATGSRLVFDGPVGIGDCPASLTGTLEKTGDQIVFHMESYRQL